MPLYYATSQAVARLGLQLLPLSLLLPSRRAAAVLRRAAAAEARILTALSYVFYGWANPLFVPLLLFSTVVDFLCGLYMARAGSRG
jgi:fatty acid desaturase